MYQPIIFPDFFQHIHQHGKPDWNISHHRGREFEILQNQSNRTYRRPRGVLEEPSNACPNQSR